jgi:hypothetical protein
MSGRSRRLPTFLVIGAARSGSSSLHDSLRQHPQVFVSAIKEPHFFSYENKELPRGGPGGPRRTWITDIDRYMELFDRAKPGVAAGEASVSYLYSAEAPDRIRHHVPDVRLIAILRNPVERAYSAFLYLRERGREPYADFVNALEAEDERVREDWPHMWHYRRMGFYGEQLARYYERFNRDQIHVLTLDDFVADPQRAMAAVYAHIGVDPAFAPNTAIQHNVTGAPRWRVLSPLLTPNRATTVLRPLVKATLNPVVRRVKQRVLVKAQLPAEAASMLARLYRKDVELLGRLLGRDLSSWLAAYDSSAPLGPRE